MTSGNSLKNSAVPVAEYLPEGQDYVYWDALSPALKNIAMTFSIDCSAKDLYKSLQMVGEERLLRAVKKEQLLLSREICFESYGPEHPQVKGTVSNAAI